MEDPSDAPAPGQDTQAEVTTPTPEGDTGGNWEQRYKDLQSDYTRKTQSLAQAEPLLQTWQGLQSDETRAEAVQRIAEAAGGPEQLLRSLGYEIDGAPTDTPEDDVFRDPRVDQLLQERQAEQAQRQQDEQIAALDSHVEQQLGALAEANGKPLSEDEQSFVVAHAVASLPPNEDGTPQIRQAYDQLRKLQEAWQQQWLESKKAPHITNTGVPGEKAIDLTDDRTRREVTANILAEHMND